MSSLKNNLFLMEILITMHLNFLKLMQKEIEFVLQNCKELEIKSFKKLHNLKNEIICQINYVEKEKSDLEIKH